MAAPDLRIVRRPRGKSRTKALVAASAAIDDPAKPFKIPIQFGGRTGWQTEAWNYYDAVGELRYYVSWRSNACSRVRLIASELDDEGTPTGKCSNARVSDIARSIGGGQLGRSQMIKRAVQGLSVPGDTWIAVLYLPDSPESGTWLAFSRDEIKKKHDKLAVDLPSGEEYELGPDDTIFPVWEPHPRKAQEADSPVRAAQDALAEIVRTTRKIRNADNSRLIGNGVVFVPQEMSLPMSAGPTPAGQIGTDGQPTAGSISGAPAVQELQELIFQVAQASFKDEDSFAAMVPIFASVPGEMIGQIQHMIFGAEITDQAIKTRNDAIARLAMSLDVSPERLLGLGSSTNHWSAWQIGDTDVSMHIAPMMELICLAITERVFRNALAMAGIAKPEDYVLWYDASHLTADPDNSDNATEAFDRGVISAEAYRDFLNLGDSGYDLLNGGIPEWKRWAVDQIAQDPDQLVKLLPLLDPALQELDFPVMIAVEEGTGGSAGADDGQSTDDTSDGSDPETEDKGPGYDQGKRGRPKDAAAGQAIVGLMVSRALELAGKRRRNRANHDRLRGVPLHHAHRVMGPVDDAEIPALIAGWDSSLEEDTLALVGMDLDMVRAEVKRQVRAQLTAQVVDA